MSIVLIALAAIVVIGVVVLAYDLKALNTELAADTRVYFAEQAAERAERRLAYLTEHLDPFVLSAAQYRADLAREERIAAEHAARAEDAPATTWNVLPLDVVAEPDAPRFEWSPAEDRVVRTVPADVADTLDSIPGPILADVLPEARGWIDDCELACVPADDLPVAEVWETVAALYGGGIPAFVTDALADVHYAPAEVTA